MLEIGVESSQTYVVERRDASNGTERSSKKSIDGWKDRLV